VHVCARVEIVCLSLKHFSLRFLSLQPHQVQLLREWGTELAPTTHFSYKRRRFVASAWGNPVTKPIDNVLQNCVTTYLKSPSFLLFLIIFCAVGFQCIANLSSSVSLPLPPPPPETMLSFCRCLMDMLFFHPMFLPFCVVFIYLNCDLN